MDAAIRKAKDSIGNMFDKNLHDLVRGIRNHKENEAKYIAECIDEIKLELKQDNMAVKANAINKLCYLEMLGYDISWAAFNIIEVMSSTKFTYKRIGYLAASQSFHEGTDVLMLTTNMIRKDLGSQNMYEAGIALSGLSCFLSADLARDLANEIMTLMTSSKPYLRKKAVLIMYKIFLKYPDALRPSFPRLKEKLDDPESSVQAAAVNVICELARKNPKNYLSLAPIFFKLMTVSTNNWVLIKIIKLFGALTPLEPRLGKKLIEPLTNLINSTSAMSLLYECINTVLAVLVSISSGQPNHNSAIEICLQKLRILIEDSDQNLKYLGLLAMSKILQTNPKSVQTHKDLIMQCLDDKDESIRLRSLDLLYGMVSKKNLMEIIKKLMVHMNKAEGTHYRDELLAKIVDICSQNNYQHVTNFEWYVSVLVELTRMEGTRHGKLLSSQMLDVAIRVESIRPFIVAQMAILLDNIHVFTSNSTSLVNNNNTAIKNNTSDVCEVLYSATWICGEFAVYLNDSKKTLESMLKSKINNLPGHIQAAFVQNIFKLYVHIINKLFEMSTNEENDEDYVYLTRNELSELKMLTKSVFERLQLFEQNADIEVQERASTMLQLLKYVQKIIEKHESNEIKNNLLENSDEISSHKIPRIDMELIQLFEGDLNPVAVKAQKKVPLPDGLNLDEWINEEPSDTEDNENEVTSENQMFLKNDYINKNQQPSQLSYTSLSSSNLGSSTNYGGNSSSTYNMAASLGAKKIQPELSQDDLAKYKESRKQQIDSNPFYIKSSNLSGVKKSESNNLITTSSNKHVGNNQPNESIRSQSIDLKIPLSIPGVTSSDKYYRMTQIDYENNKLKKKMKNKVDKKKKTNNDDDDDNNDEDDDFEMPTVKVLSNEMPDGVADDSGEDSKKMDINDPHRALDINLDEPLRANETLHVSTHRKTESKPSKQQTNNLDEKPKEKKKKEKESSKKPKAEKEKKKKTKENKTDLLTIDVNVNDHVDSSKTNDYNELLSPEQEIQQQPEIIKKINNNNDDDIDFWLSNDNKIENEPNPLEVVVATAAATTSEEKKVKKSKKKDKEIEDDSNTKKEKKKKAKKLLTEITLPSNTDLEKQIQNVKTNGSLSKVKSYQLLASNKHMKIKYTIQPNYMNFNQIVVKFKMINILTQLTAQIHSIELIILDTHNLKLIRNEPFNSETIKLPFALNASTENEIEFLFNITDCTFPQKLKGILTYMLKSDELGIVHEKIDFKLDVPCSKYLIKNASDSEDLTKWLSSGQLNNKTSIKLDSLNYDNINSILDILCLNFTLTIVETIDDNASVYTSSLQNQPICILMKYINSKTLTIEAKSTNLSLIQNILEEFKSILTAS